MQINGAADQLQVDGIFGNETLNRLRSLQETRVPAMAEPGDPGYDTLEGTIVNDMLDVDKDLW